MAITNARMQMRRGLEADFDPDKMQPGEWAVSLDKKYVRMCFSVGVCVRMATYDAFEEDMAQIEEILSKCETIEEAVAKINTEVSANAKAVAEYTEQAKKYRDEAKAFRDEAESIAGIGVATKDKAGIVKPDGETITVDEDGTIHANGSQGTIDYEELENKPQINGVELSGNKSFEELGFEGTKDYSVLENKPSINGTELSGNKSLSDLGIASATDLEKVNFKVDTVIEHVELNIKNSASGESIHLTDSANSKVVEFGLYGKATQDGEPTPDNPIEITVSGSDGSVEVVSCGKNLLKHNAMSQTVNGVTFTANNDGSIKLSGTASADIYYNLFKNRTIDTLKNGNVYTVSGNDNDSCQFFVYNVTQGKGYGKYYSAITEMTVNDSDLFNVGIKVLNGSVVNTTIYPMIRLASDTDATYEPYKETVSTISTPNGLAGIPVSSGGNYTDENGQQWITDEIVKYADGSGKRIQRIGKAVFDGSSDEEWVLNSINTNIFQITMSNRKRVQNAICSHYTEEKNWNNFIVSSYAIFAHKNNSMFQFTNVDLSSVEEWVTNLKSNPISVYYELAESIITDLTAEEIAEIEKLHTFYPITNIANDSGCGMAVTYIADSKNYIDGQLAIQKAQQEAAMLNMLLLLPEETQAAMIENDTNNLLNESEV